MLWTVATSTLAQAAADPEFLALYDRAIDGLDGARAARNTWWTRTVPHLAGQTIAYFSAEFALHQSLPIYAGGLGVLAGDHCKEASDLGVPLVGVGFMYPQGYFHQRLSGEGWQEESYERLNWNDAPIDAATTPDGKPCIIAVPLGDRSVLITVWRVRLGRVVLYLLDTDLEENAPGDRRALGAPVWRRSRDAHPAGGRARNRRGPRAEGPGHPAVSVPPQRRTRGVRRPAANPQSRRSGCQFRRRACRRSAGPRFSPPTRRCRRATTRSRSIW